MNTTTSTPHPPGRPPDAEGLAVARGSRMGTTIPAVTTARAHDWRPFVKNTLRGLFSLTLPSGMIVHHLTYHVKNGSQWVGIPSQKFTEADGSVSYTPTIEFVDRAAADRFRDLAMVALKELGVIE